MNTPTWTWLNPRSVPSAQPWYRCRICETRFYGSVAAFRHALRRRHQVVQIS